MSVVKTYKQSLIDKAINNVITRYGTNGICAENINVKKLDNTELRELATVLEQYAYNKDMCSILEHSEYTKILSSVAREIKRRMGELYKTFKFVFEDSNEYRHFSNEAMLCSLVSYGEFKHYIEVKALKCAIYLMKEFEATKEWNIDKLIKVYDTVKSNKITGKFMGNTKFDYMNEIYPITDREEFKRMTDEDKEVAIKNQLVNYMLERDTNEMYRYIRVELSGAESKLYNQYKDNNS